MELLVSSKAIRVAGVTLVTGPNAESVLEAVSERTESGRRYAWLHNDRGLDSFATCRAGEQLAAGRIDLLVASGSGGREIALAARDAGLELSRALVCSNAALAQSMLLGELRRGDIVGLIGVDPHEQAELIASLAPAARPKRTAA